MDKTARGAAVVASSAIEPECPGAVNGNGNGNTSNTQEHP
jgi:hypothetical protein